jgi:TIR domain
MDTSLPPLRTLSILANPADLPRFDDDALWRQFCGTLQSFQAGGSLICERLEPASANSLRNSLSSSPWNVLHFIVHGQERAAAHYGTIALKSSDGRAGNITAQALAALLAPCSSLALVVIQSACDGPLCFQTVADELIARGIAGVLIAPRFSEQLQSLFLARLYGGLLLGLNSGQLADYIAAAHPVDSTGFDMVRVLGRDAQRPLFAAPAAVASKVAAAAPVPVSPAPPAVAPTWQEILQRKMDAEAFDVFLCHNSADKPMVRRIGQQLKEAGILPWLDVEQLPPGRPWQPLLEQQIKKIRSAAVCFGAAGIGPWQQQEMYGFLSAFVRRGAPVIPLLLPDAPLVPELPVFLAEMTWVDFRSQDSEPLKRLIWGITGKRPDI